MTEVYLCFLDNVKDLDCYVVRNADLDSDNDCQLFLARGKNFAPIAYITISTSIFSPLILQVGCLPSDFSEVKIIPYHSVFGVIFINYDDNEEEENKNGSSCCLFSHFHEQGITPFILTEAKYDETSKLLVLTLMEKRALSLALTHSFACIGKPDKSNRLSKDKGSLSIAEIVKELSCIPEQEDVVRGEEKNNKSIFTFNSYSYDESEVEGYSYSTDLKKSNCAVLSRFIASPSQSRLEIISSLMFKYGYGFVYRMADRQYYAVDLLSNDAPGFYNPTEEKCIDGSYYDNYIFLGHQSKRYFGDYGRLYLLANKISPERVDSFDKLAENKYKGRAPSYFCHNFEDFYINRLLERCTAAQQTIYYTDGLGPRDYNYLSRYAPLSSATSFLSNIETSRQKQGFDLLTFARIPPKEKKSVKRRINSMSKSRDLNTFMFQDNSYSELSGAQNIVYEDQAELNLQGGVKTRSNAIFDGEGSSIATVNARLAYAKYKLNHMQNNYMEQVFCFKKNEGLSVKFNIVYELLNWLGFHTDVFQKVAKCYKSKTDKREFPTSSGSPIVQKYEFDPPKDIDDNLRELFKIDEEFPVNLHNYLSSPVIFGRLHIEIESDLDDDGKPCYTTTAKLNFFSDDITNNFGNLWVLNEIYKKRKYGKFFNDSANKELYEPSLILPGPKDKIEFTTKDLKVRPPTPFPTEDEYKRKKETGEEPIRPVRDIHKAKLPKKTKELIKGKIKKNEEDESVFDFSEFEDWAFDRPPYNKEGKTLKRTNGYVDILKDQFLEEGIVDLNPLIDQQDFEVEENSNIIKNSHHLSDTEDNKKRQAVSLNFEPEKPEVVINNESVDRLQKNPSQESSEAHNNYMIEQLRKMQAHALRIVIARYKFLRLNPLKAKNKETTKKGDEFLYEMDEDEEDSGIQKLADDLVYDDVENEAKYIPKNDKYAWGLIEQVSPDDFLADEP